MCGFCGSSDHDIDLCPETNSGQSNRANIHCSFCESNTHNLKACPHTLKGSANRAWHRNEIKNDLLQEDED
jgi:hypothetical protein